MKEVLHYKGYTAELHLDVEDKIIVGKVINTADIISFHGNTMLEVEQAFHDVLDTYLETCKKENIEPSRPYSGKFNLRITPNLHKKLSVNALRANMSLNEYTEYLITKGLNKDSTDDKSLMSN